MKPMILIAKAWRLHLLLWASLGMSVMAGILDSPIRIPARDVSDIVFPLFPLAVSTAYTACDEVLTTAPFESRHHNRRLRRLALWIIALLVGLAGSWGATTVSAASFVVLARNTTLFLGIVSIFGPRGASSVSGALASYCSITWIIGSNGINDQPQWWALPLYPADSASALWIAVVTGVISAIAVVGQRPIERQ